jgi:hypothetical protein
MDLAFAVVRAVVLVADELEGPTPDSVPDRASNPIVTPSYILPLPVTTKSLQEHSDYLSDTISVQTIKK